MNYVNRVFNHSCETMSEIPDGVVHTCITSPPYYGLRDYGIDGQIGREPTVAEYVDKIVAVFREVRRVLRGDGTAWLNLGDGYASKPVGKYNGSPGLPNRAYSLQGHATSGGIDKVKASGLKEKDLMLVPHAVAIALRADGWWLRDAIVWNKPACMPSSVSDRCTPTYEMVFMLAKSRRYMADMDAVKEPEGGNIRNVWTIATEPYAGAHFATMPRELVRRCILIGSPAGGLVLDPFMGSGTVADVALGCGRQYVGYELNPEYHKLISDRLGLFGAA